VNTTWRSAPTHQHLADGAVHVWRIPIDAGIDTEPYFSVLSREEQERARKFRDATHEDAYVVAHGTMRMILAAYIQVPASDLTFESSPPGKPSLANASQLEFNLAHSGGIALLAVAREKAVGVDVEQWNANIDHETVADRCFSEVERDALRSLRPHDRRIEGFFAAWSRKEAYLKATGHGVSQGLDHFDVTLTPGEAANLITDRRDSDANKRWMMVSLDVGRGYSAALVAATPVSEILLFDATAAAASFHANQARTQP